MLQLLQVTEPPALQGAEGPCHCMGGPPGCWSPLSPQPQRLSTAEADAAQIPWGCLERRHCPCSCSLTPSHPVPSPQGAPYQQHFLLLRGASPKDKLRLNCCLSAPVCPTAAAPVASFGPCAAPVTPLHCSRGHDSSVFPRAATSLFSPDSEAHKWGLKLPMSQTQWLHLAITAPTTL